MEQLFNYKDLTVRTITDDEENTWFAGVDVCNILGYAMPSNVIKDNLDEDERKLTNLTDRSGQQRKAWTINEFGLYSLILTSSKPEAKAFKRWITHEVLPSIRKAGKFTTDQVKEHEMSLQNVVNSIENLQEEKEEYQGKVNEVKRQIQTRYDEMIKLVKMDRSQLRIEFQTKE